MEVGTVDEFKTNNDTDHQHRYHHHHHQYSHLRTDGDDQDRVQEDTHLAGTITTVKTDIGNATTINNNNINTDDMISMSADWWKPWVDKIARPFSIVGINSNINNGTKSSSSWCVPRKLTRVKDDLLSGTSLMYDFSSPGTSSLTGGRLLLKRRRPETIKDHSNQPNPLVGLYLVKVPKTASSTAAGVTIQIAEGYIRDEEQNQRKNSQPEENSNNDTIPQHWDVLKNATVGLDDNIQGTNRGSNLRNDNNINMNQRMECTYHIAHGSDYVSRIEPNFVWTVLRIPSTRALSHYFFENISRKGTVVTPDGTIQYLDRSKNFQLDYIAKMSGSGKVRHSLKSTSLTTALDVVEIIQRDILDTYGFIALTERMDESLVLLKMILGVPLQDVIVLSSKVRGGLDDGRFENKCVRIVEWYTTPKVDTYIQSDYPLGNYDFFLYAVVNRSLDMTIDMIGRDRFQRELEQYRRAKTMAEDQCLDSTIFPCIVEGDPPIPDSRTSCLVADIGCGYECIRRVLGEDEGGVL